MIRTGLRILRRLDEREAQGYYPLERLYNVGKYTARAASAWINMARFRKNYVYGNSFKRRKISHGGRGSARRGLRMAKGFANKRGTSGRGLTFQHDRQFIYKKKRMPRRMRRRWRGFVRKVHAVDERSLGTRTVLFNVSTTFDNTTAFDQIVGTIALYGNNSTDSWLNDLRNISGLENLGDQTQLAGDTVYKSSKYMFQSGVLDITMRNTTDKNDGNLEAEATLEVDLYEMSVGVKGRDSIRTYNNLKDYFDVAANDTGILNNTGTPITIGKRGCTPFDVPSALSRYKMKIWKKTKFFLKSGQTLTYQCRDPRRHVVNHEDIVESIGCNRRGWTKFILVIAKVIPGITVGTTPNVREQLEVGITRKYMYKVEGMRDNRHRWINS